MGKSGGPWRLILFSNDFAVLLRAVCGYLTLQATGVILAGARSSSYRRTAWTKSYEVSGGKFSAFQGEGDATRIGLRLSPTCSH